MVRDLKEPFRYRLFDALGMMLDRCINEKQENDGYNVWVALAVVYLNTPSPQQFVWALRGMDLQLYEGRFDKPELASAVQEWQRADEQYQRTLSEDTKNALR